MVYKLMELAPTVTLTAVDNVNDVIAVIAY